MTQRSAGPVPSPSHWARIQLVQGSSDGGLFDLSSSVPEARVTVGSSAQAKWVVNGPTVEPLHFEFYWDGKALWISPPTAGDLTVDGERLNGWRQLVGRARIEFGGAAMLAETSATIAMPHSAQQQIDEIAQSPTVVHSGGSPPPARSAPPPPRGRGKASVPPPPPRGRPPASMPPPPPRSAPAADLTPSLGAAPRIVVPPSSRQVPPLSSLAVDSGESTALFDDVSAMPSSVSVPAFGDMTPSLEDLGAVPAFGSSQSTQIFDAEAAGLDMSGSIPMPAAPAPQAPSLSHLSTDVMAGRNQEDARFVAPPPVGLPSDKKKPTFELPPRRTLILAGVTLVAALLLLVQSFISKANQREALAEARRAALVAEQERAATATAAAQEEADRRLAAVASAESALLVRAGEDAEEVEERAREDALEAMDPEYSSTQVRTRLREAEQQAVEGLAVRAASQNDHPGALGFYLYLAEKYPSESAYPTIATILRLKVNCEGGICQ